MFTQKIYMNCTREQFKLYLKEELLKIGKRLLIYDNVWQDFNTSCIVTFFSDDDICIGNMGESGHANHNRRSIGQFNAPLFLALAAMTNEEYGGYGEYWKFIGETTMEWTKNKLYKANGSLNGYLPFIDDSGHPNNTSPTLYFQKATVEEIQRYFSFCSINKNILSDWNTAAMKRSGPILPAITPPIIVPYQLCPKCKGEGDLPAFSDPFGHTTNSTSSQRKPCDVCFGNKIIPMHVIK